MNKLEQLEKRILELEHIIFGITEIKKEHPLIAKCLKNVSKLKNQPIRLIRSKSRKRTIVECRFMVISYLRENTRLSLSEIGAIFGGRDHATMLNAITKHKDLLDTDKKYKSEYEQFCDNL